MQFSDIRILVLGDIMLDKYVVGVVERISPEAPVPVVHVTKEFSTLGGCGNVVRNLKEVGVDVCCVSAIADDADGSRIEKYLNLLNVKHFLFKKLDRTIVKERILEEKSNTQMVRVDREKIQETEVEIPKEVLEDVDAIVISDYAKGFVTSSLMQQIEKLSKKVIVDPKPKNIDLYRNTFMITPNRREWSKIRNSNIVSTIDYVLLTKGNEGMELYNNSSSEVVTISSIPVPVYNVSGAGDVVVAIVSVCLSYGLDIVVSCMIANDCAAYTVTQAGTSVVTKNKFLSVLQEHVGGKNNVQVANRRKIIS